jgi:dTDP-4-dehydrorhamnose reductase
VEIFEAVDLRPNLTEQTTEQSGAKATRPTYSVLDNHSLKELGLDRMPPWRDALRQYLTRKGHVK